MTKPDFHPPPPSPPPPAAMGGTQRMVDPSETEHDLRRRRWMNIGFLLILVLGAAEWRWFGIRGWDAVRLVALVLAGVPLSMTVRVFELRFKLAADERQTLLRQLPRRVQWRWVGYALVLLLAVATAGGQLAAVLLGMWGADFVGYYHDRPQRMRHLYAVTATLDDLRDFPAPWAWVVPALVAAGLTAALQVQ